MTLTDEQLNEWSAVTVMGWVKGEKTGYDNGYSFLTCQNWENKPGETAGYFVMGESLSLPYDDAEYWNPTQDRNHTQMVLERVAEMKLTAAYQIALDVLLRKQHGFIGADTPRSGQTQLSLESRAIWEMLTATPRQIMDAVYQAMEGEG